MSFFKKIDRHASLVNRMGERLNASLDQALSEKQVSPEAYRRAVIRCCACPQADACEQENTENDGAQPGAKQAASAPDYCRNKSLFSGLTGKS